MRKMVGKKPVVVNLNSDLKGFVDQTERKMKLTTSEIIRGAIEQARRTPKRFEKFLRRYTAQKELYDIQTELTRLREKAKALKRGI